MNCSACGSRDIDVDESSGHSFCVSCGQLLEENAIVQSLEWAESGDRSEVVGQFVAASCSRPFAAGRGHFGSGRESREASMHKMRMTMSQISATMNLPEDGMVERAISLYNIVMDKNFVFGRKQNHVAAICLYAICRKEKKPHLLIDFSDSLSINVYILGKSFLQFSRLLNLNLPVIDPSLFIHRFSLRLELGEKINQVNVLALRIVSRLQKDWITIGRRPDGICAAALLISCRAHGFSNHLQEDIVKIFRVSGDTIKKRLEEFKCTPSAQLTVAQFFNNSESKIEFDPPSYIRNVLNENRPENVNFRLEEIENGEINENEKMVKMKIKYLNDKTNDKANSMNNSYDKDDDDNERYNRSMNNIINQENEENEEDFLERTVKAKIGEIEIDVPIPIFPNKKEKNLNSTRERMTQSMYNTLSQELDLDNYIENNLNNNLNNLNEDVKEEEILIEDIDVDKYLLNPEEQNKKSLIWEKNFRGYMDEMEVKRKLREEDEMHRSKVVTKSGRVRKKSEKRDLPKETAGQAILENKDIVKKTSKKINYDALAGSFDENGQIAFIKTKENDEENFADKNNKLFENRIEPKAFSLVEGMNFNQNQNISEEFEEVIEEEDNNNLKTIGKKRNINRGTNNEKKKLSKPMNNNEKLKTNSISNNNINKSSTTKLSDKNPQNNSIINPNISNNRNTILNKINEEDEEEEDDEDFENENNFENVRERDYGGYDDEEYY